MKKVPILKIDIRNQGENEAIIDIDGEIGWVNENGEWNTGPAIKAQLKEISELKAKKIVVNIASLGGYVDEGLQIHDILAQHEAEIETRITSMTASAATIIAQAGDIRKMSDNALYLIHRAWGFAFGNVNDMIAAAGDLEVIDNRIANIYAKRSGKTLKEVMKIMNENDGSGKWIDADEAKELGLIDEVFEPMKAAAAVDPDLFNSMHLPIPEGAEIKKEDPVNHTGDKHINIKMNLDAGDFKKELDEIENRILKINETISKNKNKAHKMRVVNLLKLKNNG